MGGTRNAAWRGKRRFYAAGFGWRSWAPQPGDMTPVAAQVKLSVLLARPSCMAGRRRRWRCCSSAPCWANRATPPCWTAVGAAMRPGEACEPGWRGERVFVAG